MLRRITLQDSESGTAVPDEIDLRDGAGCDDQPSAAAVANPRRTRR
jgi:hypothetical protein